MNVTNDIEGAGGERLNEAGHASLYYADAARTWTAWCGVDNGVAIAIASAMFLLGFLTVALATPPVDALDAWLQQRADDGAFIGVVRVVNGEQVLLDRAYGAVPDDPVCRIGSVSKSFTAATVYALHDEGVLSVDRPIGDYLPEVKSVIGDGPSLRALLTHRGGLSEPAANVWMRPPTWSEQASLMLPQLNVQVPPGERFAYSNFGYTLLSAAVATVAGQPFEAVMASRLLEPLGLRDTGIERTPDRDARLVRGRVMSPLGLLDAQRTLPRLMPYDYRWPHGGDGALTSTPADLVRWAEGLRDGHVLSDASRAALITADGDDMAAGWGRRGPQVWHNGALYPLGIYAYLRWSVEDRVVVAVCATPTVGEVSPEWGRAIEAILAGEPVPDVVVRGTPIGWFASVSALYGHWWLGLGAVLVGALIPGRRARRVATAVLTVPLAALAFGLTHGALSVVGGLAALLTVAWRWRRDAPEPSSWPAWLGVFVAGWFALVPIGLMVAMFGVSYMVEAVWTFGG